MFLRNIYKANKHFIYKTSFIRSFTSNKLDNRNNKNGEINTDGSERNPSGGRKIDKPFYLNDPRDDTTYLFPPQGPPKRDIRIYDEVPKDKIYRRPEWAAPTKPLGDQYDIIWTDTQAPEPIIDQHEYFRNFREYWDGAKIVWGIIGILVLGSWLYERKPPATPRELPFDNGFIDTGSVNTPSRNRTDRYDPIFIEWINAKHNEGMKHEWYRKELGYKK